MKVLNTLKQVLTLSLLLAVFTTSAVFQPSATGNADLYIVKCKADEGICDTQEIVRFTFEKGVLVSTNTLASFDTKEVRFDLGSNWIYNDRRLITGWGDVVDLETGKLLFKSKGDVVGNFGSKLLIDVDRVDDDDLFTLDLNTLSIFTISSNDNLEDLQETDFSPNGKVLARWDQDDGFSFFEVDPKLNLRKLRDVKGEFSATCSLRCSSFSKAKFVWIDDQTVLTIESNERLASIDLSGKVKRFKPLTFDEQPDWLPHLSRDRQGNVFYEHFGIDYFVNLRSRSLSRVAPLATGFSSISEGQFWQSFYFQGKSIGRHWSSGLIASQNFLATEYAAEGTNLGYPDGIKVWNTFTREWLTIEVSWGVRLVGWVEE